LCWQHCFFAGFFERCAAVASHLASIEESGIGQLEIGNAATKSLISQAGSTGEKVAIVHGRPLIQGEQI
jgi:hypothetical protein